MGPAATLTARCVLVLGLAVTGCGGSGPTAGVTESHTRVAQQPSSTSAHGAAGHHLAASGRRHRAVRRSTRAQGTAAAGARSAATTSRTRASAPTGSTPSPRRTPSTAALDATEVLHKVAIRGGAILESGSVSGRPLGSGRIDVRAVASARVVLARFRVVTRTGSMGGIARLRIRAHGGRILYSGSARLVGGTGAYRA